MSKSIINISTTFLLGFACMAQSAQAQDFPSEPDWKVSAYLWAMALDGVVEIGPIEADFDLSFSDLLKDLNYGAAVVITREWGRNVLVADLSYYSLSPDDITTPLGGSISTDLNMPLLQLYYGRKTALGNGFAGWLVGARYMELDTKLTRTPIFPSTSSGSEEPPPTSPISL